MFTGLIEAVGAVADVKSHESGMRMRIRTGLARELSPGDSLAVNGVCLTVVLTSADEVHADIGPETARVTTLGSLRRDQAVNLERPLRADGRFGGHFVLGHVDGVGTVDDIRSDGDAHWFTIAFGRDLAAYFIRKGSIAVDGISLTIAGLDEEKFDVMVIPFTWNHTNLHTLRVPHRVNLECDMIGKYVARATELHGKEHADTHR
jgi:riboflavin synthase